MKKNLFKVLASNIIQLCISLVTGFIFPKIMSYDSYAEYQTYNLYLLYIVICTLGIGTGMAINYAGVKYDTMNKETLKGELKLHFLILSIFTLIGLGIYLYYRNTMILCVALSIIPYCFGETYKSLLQSWSMFGKYAAINTFIPLFRAMLSLVIFIVTKDLGGLAVVILTIVGYLLIALYALFQLIKTTKGYQAGKAFTKYNFQTTWFGFQMMLGGYLVNFFESIDKLFIKRSFETISFATYTFAISTQSVMTVFVSAVARPLLPYMASGEMKEEHFKFYKKTLLCLGSLSGCAYQAIAFIIGNFMKKYEDSISIIFAYFLIFPALSVINCLIINLFRIRKETRNFILSTLCLLIITICFNYFALNIFKSEISIALVTVLVYYIWFFYGCLHFKSLGVELADVLYLLAFIMIYFVSGHMGNEIIGCMVYSICIFFIIFLYNRTLINRFYQLIDTWRNNR